MVVTSIRNETPSRLTLVSIEGDEMELAPLQQKAIGEDSRFDFTDLEREGIVSQYQDAPTDLGSQLSTLILGGGFWLVIIASFLANKEKPLFGVDPATWPWAVWGFGASIMVVAVGVMIVRGTNSFSLVVRWTMQTLALTVILLIGVGLPAASIYFFGDGEALLAKAFSSAVQQAGSPSVAPLAVNEPVAPAPLEGNTASLALFGRLLQLGLISIASLLPVLLFFLFDRYKLGTLRRRLYISLFRLEPTLQTRGEIDARYGPQIDEAYGPADQGRGRLAAGSRWPVLVCALVITIGWIIALAPVGQDFAPINASDVVVSLQPQQTTLVMGFLGAYFYSLRLIAIRYARGDLKPKAYSHIMVRIFIVAVLSWVLGVVSPDHVVTTTLALLLAFLFGIMPDEFFVWVKENFRSSIPGSAIPEPELPLNKLEGIDLYDLGRLEAEGIVNIEGLAHHELMDLIIETRIPVPRLMDWLDQSILYLHVTGGSDEVALATLRDYGIRTATDLEIAWARAAQRGDDALAALKKILGGEAPLYRLEVIRDALSDDEWYAMVKNWRDDRERPPLRREAFPSSAEGLLELARKEQQAERYAKAIEFLKQSIAARDNAPARRLLARLLADAPVVNLRDPDAARQHAGRAFQLGEDDYEGLLELFDIWMLLEDIGEAERTHERALRIVNQWPDSRSKDRQAEKARLQAFRKRLDAATRT